jgi:hypothetical protein
MIGTSRSGGSLLITYSSTNHKIRTGISEWTETRVGKPLLDMAGFRFRVHALQFVLQ